MGVELHYIGFKSRRNCRSLFSMNQEMF